MRVEPIIIYTDGSCDNNTTKNGGWGAYLSYGGYEKRLSGHVKNTTSNRMELTAPLKAFRALKDHTIPVHLFSDSQYTIKGMTEWHKGWIKRGWRNTEGNPVTNKDLWIRLLDWNTKLNITWEWVRGHNGHPMQEIAHHLAFDAFKSKL